MHFYTQEPHHIAALKKTKQTELEELEASTHESANTHAGNVFVAGCV